VGVDFSATPRANVPSANRNRLLPISTSIVPKSGKPDFGGAPQQRPGFAPQNESKP
jgi:hypothetical protein